MKIADNSNAMNLSRNHKHLKLSSDSYVPTSDHRRRLRYFRPASLGDLLRPSSHNYDKDTKGMPKKEQVLASCDFLSMDDMNETRSADSSSVETPHAEESQIVNDDKAYAPCLYHDHHLEEPTTISVEEPTPFSTKGGVKMPFPAMLFHILEYIDLHEPELANIISWQPHGRSFMTRDIAKMEEVILPRFFRHNNYASFRRQMNVWGFKRLSQSGPDHNAYYHELFLRSKLHLCHGITRSTQKQRRPAERDNAGKCNRRNIEPRLCFFAALPPSSCSAPRSTSAWSLLFTSRRCNDSEIRTADSSSVVTPHQECQIDSTPVEMIENYEQDLLQQDDPGCIPTASDGDHEDSSMMVLADFMPIPLSVPAGPIVNAKDTKGMLKEVLASYYLSGLHDIKQRQQHQQHQQGRCTASSSGRKERLQLSDPSAMMVTDLIPIPIHFPAMNAKEKKELGLAMSKIIF